MAPKLDLKAEGKVISALITATKKNPHSFAMLLGKSGYVLEAHKTKSVSAMKVAAKAAGGGTKGAWGKMSAGTNVVIFECIDVPPSTFQKDAKKFFAERGHSTKVEVREAGADEAPNPEPEETTAARPAIPSSQTDAADAGPQASAEALDVNLDATDELTPATSTTATDDIASDATGLSVSDNDADEKGDEDYGEEDEGPILGEDILVTFKLARTKPLNFAWLFGDHTLILRAHRRKPVKVLIANARRAGAKPRGAWGTIDAKGSKIFLTCENTPPVSALKRLAKRQFKELGVNYKVILTAPDATFEFGGEEPETVQTPTGERTRQELAADYAAAYPQFKERIDAANGKDEKARLNAMLRAFQTAMRAGQMIEAEGVIREMAGTDEVESEQDDGTAPDPSDFMVIEIQQSAETEVPQ